LWFALFLFSTACFCICHPCPFCYCVLLFLSFFLSPSCRVFTFTRPETNHVSTVCSTAVALYLQFVLHVMVFHT
jgi:hypothetical protein